MVYMSHVMDTKYGKAISAIPMTIGLYRTIFLPYTNAPKPMAPNRIEPRSAAGLERPSFGVPSV